MSRSPGFPAAVVLRSSDDRCDFDADVRILRRRDDGIDTGALVQRVLSTVGWRKTWMRFCSRSTIQYSATPARAYRTSLSLGTLVSEQGIVLG